MRLLDPSRCGDRRERVVTADGGALGLRRRVVQTSLGPVDVRVGAVTGGPALILLHGAAGSWTTWTPLLSDAAETGAPLTDVIAIDLPGWGESRISTTGLDVAQLSRVVCEVAQALGYRRWMLVGHSLGGFLALDVAARAPTQTEGVLLISPTGEAVVDAIRRPLRGGLGLPGFAGMLLIMRMLAGLGAIGRGIVRAVYRAGLLRAVSAPLFADPAHVHHSVIDALAEEVRPRAFVDAARAAAEYDVSLWNGIDCPVRAIRGERDVFVSDADETGFRAHIDDFEQVMVHDAGHFAGVEQPQAVLEALRSLRYASRTSSASIRE